MKTKSIVYNYLEKNKSKFLVIIGIFFVGMIIGILFINYSEKDEIIEINTYVNSIINNLEKSSNINKFELLTESIKQNAIFVLIIWLLGCTIIGSGLVYLGIAYKGFSLGYTISALIASLGAKKGSIFVFASLLAQNIIFLPAIFMLAESGIKLYARITKQCVNLKEELLRHTIIMIISLVMTSISSVFEVYFSTNLSLFFKNFM